MFPFSFIFAANNGVDIVAHPMGYNGVGTQLQVSVGILSSSNHSSDMEISVQNVINTFNVLMGTNQNIILGSTNNIPDYSYDFESVLMHEMGHSLGLAHVNIGDIQGVNIADQNYTYCLQGPNNQWDFDPGTDGVIGSNDDIRGDDVNLNYFRIANNNPFGTLPSVIDETTYSREIQDLPTGHHYSTNSDRDVGQHLGYSDTEGVMQQGTFNDEDQRLLGYDDEAGLRYAMSGLDGIQGTSDDYTIYLDYIGQTTLADILISFNDTQTAFAVSRSSGVLLNADHVVITSSNIYFNSNYQWFFNDSSNVIVSGCTNLLANNYNSNAIEDDGTCTFDCNTATSQITPGNANTNLITSAMNLETMGTIDIISNVTPVQNDKKDMVGFPNLGFEQTYDHVESKTKSFRAAIGSY